MSSSRPLGLSLIKVIFWKYRHINTQQQKWCPSFHFYLRRLKIIVQLNDLCFDHTDESFYEGLKRMKSRQIVCPATNLIRHIFPKTHLATNTLKHTHKIITTIFIVLQIRWSFPDIARRRSVHTCWLWLPNASTLENPAGGPSTTVQRGGQCAMASGHYTSISR